MLFRWTLYSLVALPVLVSAQQCDQCQFDSNDASDCTVYGTINGILVEWSRASQECLDAYDIKINTPDPSIVGCGNTPNINSFVNAIRFGTLENSVLGGLGNEFFVQGANGIYSLSDAITVNGESFDCKASESNCYNAMKDYFATTTGMREMQDVCGTLRAKVINDKENEQGILRTRLCQEIQMDGVVDACSILGGQVNQQMEKYPDKDCSGFAFGTAAVTVPGCEGAATNTGGGATSNGGSRIRVGVWSLLVSAVLVASWLLS